MAKRTFNKLWTVEQYSEALGKEREKNMRLQSERNMLLKAVKLAERPLSWGGEAEKRRGEEKYQAYKACVEALDLCRKGKKQHETRI